MTRKESSVQRNQGIKMKILFLLNSVKQIAGLFKQRPGTYFALSFGQEFSSDDLTTEYLEESPDVETWNKVMFEDDDKSTFVAMQSQALLVGNEYSQIDENRH